MKAPTRVSSFDEFSFCPPQGALLGGFVILSWASWLAGLKKEKKKLQFQPERPYFDIRYFRNLFQPILLTEICWYNGTGLNVSHKSRNFLLLLVASITSGLFVLVRFNVIGNRVINYFNFSFCPKI